MIEVFFLFGIVLCLIPITLARLFVAAFIQYMRGDQLHLLSEILRRVSLWRAQYDENCKLCLGEGDLLSIICLHDRINRRFESAYCLPCGEFQRFESAYLQLMNLADIKPYDSKQISQFGGSIYDLSSWTLIRSIHLAHLRMA
ncbi:cytochrome b6-f complex subunit 5 [Phtheirospermum japonicum]|uniref:Cytochrome b6-f complex subunit 5 n=1 Tax=Phtheirospermum japonicum TaxID=374723 RepID=A0A830CRP4_9LAMI|nr:cytochrome b6-f complex subunit 5 [Phtheirospermum japonicum]